IATPPAQTGTSVVDVVGDSVEAVVVVVTVVVEPGIGISSNAPMSHTTPPRPSPSKWRGSPRWSVISATGGVEKSVHPAGGPASIAGLPATRAIVDVTPPLSPIGASPGSTGDADVPTWSPVDAANVQPAPLPSRLWPCEVTVETQSGPVGAMFPAMTEFFTMTLALPPRMPPPDAVAVLPEIVALPSERAFGSPGTST